MVFYFRERCNIKLHRWLVPSTLCNVSWCTSAGTGHLSPDLDTYVSTARYSQVCYQEDIRRIQQWHVFFSVFLLCREFTLFFTVFRSTLGVSGCAFQNIWIESAEKISKVCHQPIFVLRKRLMWEQTRPVLGHVFMVSTFLPYRLMAKTWVTK